MLGRRRNGKLLFYFGGKVAVWDNEEVLDLEDSNGCTIMSVYLMPLNFTFKMVKRVNEKLIWKN